MCRSGFAIGLITAIVLLAALGVTEAHAATQPASRARSGCGVQRLCSLPTDPFFTREWWLVNDSTTKAPPNAPPPVAGDDIDVLPAWRQTLGSASTRLAILDTGLDSQVPDLRGRIVASATILHNGGNVSDQNGHGTFVAGIAAASINDAGIVGVAPRASLLDIKMVSNGAPVHASCGMISGAILTALSLRAQVISISFGSPTPCLAEQMAVQQAWNQGALVVASVGEEGQDAATYPAAYPHVLSVAAIDDQDQILPESDRGASWVDLAAPGGPLLSDTATGAISWGVGTSFSAPLVSGAAALIWSSVRRQDHGGKVNAEVAARLEDEADPIPGTGTLWQYGRLDVCRALLESSSAC